MLILIQLTTHKSLEILHVSYDSFEKVKLPLTCPALLLINYFFNKNYIYIFSIFYIPCITHTTTVFDSLIISPGISIFIRQVDLESELDIFEKSWL